MLQNKAPYYKRRKKEKRNLPIQQNERKTQQEEFATHHDHTEEIAVIEETRIELSEWNRYSGREYRIW